jgi:anaphase-promoting complex subunit 4
MWRVSLGIQTVKHPTAILYHLVLNYAGNLLAIAWSDGAVRLVSTEGSKKVHQFQVAVEGAGRVTCLAWSPNNVSKKSFTKLICDVKESHGFGKLSEPQNEDLDLPRDLAAIDIESSLPKLSPLPSGSTT